MKQLIILLTLATSAHAATWYVRTDGGDRSQCSGTVDAPYSATVTGKACALKHPFYLFTTDDPAVLETPAWIVAGGDTVVLGDGEYRIGYKRNEAAGYWNFRGCRGDPFNCTNPVLPTGTPANPTRIVGASWQSGCSSKPVLRGGFAVADVLNLKGAKDVVVECLEISDFAQCGTGNIGTDSCIRSGFPKSDYALRGIRTDLATDNLLLKDVYIHGMAQMGIRGRIGGTIRTDNLRIAGIQGGGWDNDDGRNPDGTLHYSTGTLIMRNSLIEWVGCLEEYPVVSPLPYYKCFDQGHGGYGDGLGLLVGQGMTVDIETSVFRYNVQDGVDLLYAQGNGNKIRAVRSASYANGGQQWKFGMVDWVVFENNLTVANCRRLAEPVAGLPATYSAGLTEFCRAIDGIALVFSDRTHMDWTHNTMVGYTSTLFDLQCGYDRANPLTCPNARFNYKNNVLVGYPRKDTGRTPTAFYYVDISPDTLFAGDARQNNFTCGVLTSSNPPMPSETWAAQCPKTWLANEPAFVNEADLDALNLRANPAGPLVDTAVATPVVHDFAMTPRPLGSASDVGAYEVAGGSTPPPPPPPSEPPPAVIEEFNFAVKVTCEKGKPCSVSVAKQ